MNNSIDYDEEILYFLRKLNYYEFAKSKDTLKWSFGFYDIKVINISDYVFERLGSYIFKLTNHATKETTKNRIITPRGEFSFAKLLKK